jgi:hypothetical protein
MRSVLLTHMLLPKKLTALLFCKLLQLLFSSLLLLKESLHRPIKIYEDSPTVQPRLLATPAKLGAALSLSRRGLAGATLCKIACAIQKESEMQATR